MLHAMKEKPHDGGHVTLLHASKNSQSQPLARELRELCASIGATFISVHSSPNRNATSNDVKHGHIDVALLQGLISPARRSTTTAFVCGPPAFTDTVVRALEEIGLPSNSIRVESFGSSGEVSCTK